MITLPTETKPGKTGTILATAINFKTVQSVLCRTIEKNSRFVINAIKLISRTIASLSNGASIVVQEVNERVKTAATLSTTMTGANNDIVLTAVAAGVAGNAITLALIDPSGNDEELAIVVTGTDIVVNLATDGGGTITTTATLLLAALAADEDAAALVSGALKGADTGEGVVTALAEAALTGGLEWTVVQAGFVAAADLADTDSDNLIQTLTIAASPKAIDDGNSILLSITTGATATTDIKDMLVEYVVIP